MIFFAPSLLWAGARVSIISLQVSGNLGELVERSLEVLGYFKGNDVRIGQVRSDGGRTMVGQIRIAKLS